MAGNRRRNRKRLRYGRQSGWAVLKRQGITYTSNGTIIDGHLRARCLGLLEQPDETNISEAQSQIDVLREALASAVHPEHRAYLHQLLERYSVQTSWDASRATVTHYILNHEVYDIDSESSQIMHEVEQQATLEEQGILPPLEESMERWEALIEETRAMGEQEQC